MFKVNFSSELGGEKKVSTVHFGMNYTKAEYETKNKIYIKIDSNSAIFHSSCRPENVIMNGSFHNKTSKTASST